MGSDAKTQTKTNWVYEEKVDDKMYLQKDVEGKERALAASNTNMSVDSGDRGLIEVGITEYQSSCEIVGRACLGTITIQTLKTLLAIPQRIAS
jgi:hypothetical protein